MLKKIVAAIVVYLFLLAPSYAFDWKKIHEQAASTTLDQAVEKAKQKNPSAETYYFLGLAYLDDNELDKANMVFNEMLSLFPSEFEAHWCLAEVMIRKGDPAGGEVYL